MTRTQPELSREQADYQRLRQAYVHVCRTEPDNAVAQAMFSADMGRAHARLQSLLGLTEDDEPPPTDFNRFGARATAGLAA